MEREAFVETSAALFGKGLVAVIGATLLERRSIETSSFRRTGMESALLSSKVIEGAMEGATYSIIEATSPRTTAPVVTSLE